MNRIIKGFILTVAGLVFVVSTEFVYGEMPYQENMMMPHMGGGHNMMGGMQGIYPQKGMPQSMKHLTPLDLKEELHLSPKQVEDLKSLSSNKKELIRKWAEVRIAEEELSDILNEKKINLVDAEKKVKEINMIYTDIRMHWIKTNSRYKEILSEEQYDTYKQFTESEDMSQWGWDY